MATRHLKIFLYVCKHSSISKAAEELKLAQPAVSLAIKELEQNYDSLLFYRYPKRLEITNQGRLLLTRVTKLFELYHEMELNLHSNNDASSISISTSITLGKHFTPLYISKFHQIYPRIVVNQKIETNNEVIKQVLDKTVNIGFIDANIICDELEFINYHKDTIVAICPQDHPLSRLEHVSLKELSQYPLMARSVGNGDRDTIAEAFSNLGLPFNVVLESEFGIVLLNATSNGLGVALLPLNIVQGYAQHLNISTLFITDQNLVRYFSVVYRKDYILKEEDKQFIEISINQDTWLILKRK